MKQTKKRRVNRKGMSDFVMLATGFGVAVVALVIIAILLQSLLTDASVSCSTAGYVYNESSGACQLSTNASVTEGTTFSGNITREGLVFADNFSSQWGLAGTILGYVLVLAILALIGIGGYMGLQRIRGMR